MVRKQMAEGVGFTKSNEFNHLTTSNSTPSPHTDQGVTPKVYTQKQRDIADLIGIPDSAKMIPVSRLTSPLDRPLKATGFNSQKADTKQDIRHSLRALEVIIKAKVSKSKATAPWFKAARFGNIKTDKGCLRHDANVISIDGIEGDYDGGQMPIEVAAGKLKAADVAALLYESPSSTPENPRWRVISPCSTSLHPGERAALVARLQGVLGGVLDNVSFNLSQSFYFGNIEGKPPIKTALVDGLYIDDALDLDATAIGRGGRVDNDTGEPDATGSGAAFREAIALYLNGGTVDDFQAWAVEHPWKDFDRNPDKTIERTWRNAKAQCRANGLEPKQPIEFENYGPVAKPSTPQLGVVRASDVTPTPIKWIWLGRVAEGKLTIIAGDPGQGKSQVTLSIASIVSKGSNWPDGGKAPMGSVVLLSAEDGAADTTVPRLIAAKADRTKIHIVSSVVDSKGLIRGFNLRDDLKMLDAACKRIGNVTLSRPTWETLTPIERVTFAPF
jgi:hypothetical protein